MQGEAKTKEGTTREQFELTQKDGGLVVEVGRSKGPYVSGGVLRRDAKSFVNDLALGSSLSAEEHAYLGRIEVGFNRGSEYGVFSLFVGGEVPLKAGGPVLPGVYAVEGNRRVFGPDPLRAGRAGLYLGVRMGLFVGCACP